jgi:hypothetical protein
MVVGSAPPAPDVLPSTVSGGLTGVLPSIELAAMSPPQLAKSSAWAAQSANAANIEGRIGSLMTCLCIGGLD